MSVEGGMDIGTRDAGNVTPGGSIEFGVAIACILHVGGSLYILCITQTCKRSSALYVMKNDYNL